MSASVIEWDWRGERIFLDAEAAGAGPRVLLLPALSSISTRHEMHPLQDRLSQRYAAFSIDWPGFGDRARPQVDWAPETYSAFLSFLLQSVIAQPHAIIAAGHAATYVLQHAATTRASATRLVLIAPTWRGPLPTMVGGTRPWFDRLCRWVDQPGLGPLLYGLNVNRFMVRRMGAGHVYCDRSFLSGARLEEKLAVVRAPGARFGSVRFVTGRLDPLASRADFLDLARQVTAPILLIYGADTPPRSRAEMEALADVPEVRTVVLPRGKLSLHEEFPDAMHNAIDAFLREEPSEAST